MYWLECDFTKLSSDFCIIEIQNRNTIITVTLYRRVMAVIAEQQRGVSSLSLLDHAAATAKLLPAAKPAETEAKGERSLPTQPNKRVLRLR